MLPHRYLLSILVLLLSHAALSQAGPPRLSFDELVTLSRQQDLPPDLQSRLQAVLTTPTVSNRVAPPANSAQLRVTEWNIERGEELDQILQLLKTPQAFLKEARKNKKLTSKSLTTLEQQVEELRSSDILILNEVDNGVKRTDYRDVTRELADALKMSSAFAVEFLEVDSLTDLGTETAVLDTPALSARMTADLKPDRALYLGQHGNAILSRYPLTNVRVLSLPVCYDWFAQEHNGISQIEKAKRKAADLVFLERIAREVRRGNRSALVAEINPPSSTSPISIVNAHLENKCKADCRTRQMKKVLEEVGDTRGPLILGGDLNTTGADGTPTSIRYELTTRLKDYQFWISTFMQFTPVRLPVYATAPFGFWKNFRDPTALHIPVIGKNPEAQLFTTARKFKFADGGTLDFRGLPERNLQKSSRTLSDSNERARKGFVPTFSMQRDLGGIIKYRLDWIFVKPSVSEQPSMPDTLTEMNSALPERLSDHAPITLKIDRP